MTGHPRMRIERHIFGSVHGYTTLAHTGGLSPADCRALDGIAFGTPYDPAFHESLPRRPVYWSRPLDGDRRAITRVMPGDADDAGRPTLRFMTAVVTGAAWNEELEGDVRPLLRCQALWQWQQGEALTPLSLSSIRPDPLKLDAAATARVLGLVSLIELNWRQRRPVVVSEEQHSLDEIAAVEHLLPPAVRNQYSAAFRSLNGELDVSLNCVARGIAARTAALREAKSPYALLLQRRGLPQAASLGRYYFDFGEPDVTFDKLYVELGMNDSRNRRPRSLLMTGGMVALLLVALFLAGVVGWTARQATLPPTPAQPRWDYALQSAVALYGQSIPDQVIALEGLEQTLAGPDFAERPQQVDIVTPVTAALNQAQARQVTVDAIRRVTAAESDPAAAESAVATLRALQDDYAAHFAAWLQDRARLAALAAELKEQADTLLANLDAEHAASLDSEGLGKALELQGALRQLSAHTPEHDTRYPWLADRIDKLQAYIDGQMKFVAAPEQGPDPDARVLEELQGKFAAILQACQQIADAVDPNAPHGDLSRAFDALAALLEGDVSAEATDAFRQLARNNATWDTELTDLRDAVRKVAAMQGSPDHKITGPRTEELYKRIQALQQAMDAVSQRLTPPQDDEEDSP